MIGRDLVSTAGDQAQVARYGRGCYFTIKWKP